MKKKIYIIAGQFKNDHMDSFTTGIMRQANELDYDTICFSMSRFSRTKSNYEKEIYKLIDFDRCEGVVLNAESFYELKNLASILEQRIIQSNKPYTVIGTSAYTDNYFHYPYYDDMISVMDHLIEVHECRKIYCLGDVPDHDSSRIEGFKAAMKKHNLPCPQSYLMYGGFWVDCADRLAKDLAYGNVEMPDAIMCINDQIAMALVKALFRNGIKVPEDVLVAGLDGHPCAYNYNMPITTVAIDGEHLGRTAMNRLHEMLGNEVNLVPIKKRHITTGHTCGCGIKRSSHARIRLENDDDMETHRMYYRNSELQERLYLLEDSSELPIVLDNLTYLVPNMSTFSVSLLREGYQAECIFHSYWAHGDKTILFDYRDVLPPNSSMDNQVRNLHVVPLTFTDKFFGYATAGYHQPSVYNEALHKFVRDISISLSICGVLTEDMPAIPSRNRPERATTKVYKGIQQVEDENFDSSDNGSDAIVYAVREGALSKVNLESILYFEAFDKRVNVVLKSGSYEVKNTLTELEELMKTRNYMRISKSILLNLSKVSAIKPEADRSIVVVLPNQQTVRVSRKYAKEFRDKMQF